MRPSPSEELLSILKLSGLRPSATEIKKKTASAWWMRIDGHGNTSMLEADKYAIMHRVGIHARDLRILDPQLSYPSTILGRERAIVVNLEGIKAIVTSDEVLLRSSSSEEVGPFVESLQRRLYVPGSSFTHHRMDLSDDHESLEEEERSADKDDEALPLKEQINGCNVSQREKMEEVMEDDMEAKSEIENERPPFEFVALESALEYVCTFLDSSTVDLEKAAYPALDALTSKVSSLNLERVRKLKNGLSRLSARVQKVREELEHLLDDDDDMAEMFLTRKTAQPPSPSSSVDNLLSLGMAATVASRISRGSRITFSSYEEKDVEELEQLLETYFSQVEGTIDKLNTLREYIDDTEDYINIQLDNHRNQLIQIELVMNTAIMTISICGMVVAIFGMNIPFKWNENAAPHKWVVVVGIVIGTILFIIVVGYARFRRIIM